MTVEIMDKQPIFGLTEFVNQSSNALTSPKSVVIKHYDPAWNYERPNLFQHVSRRLVHIDINMAKGNRIIYELTGLFRENTAQNGDTVRDSKFLSKITYLLLRRVTMLSAFIVRVVSSSLYYPAKGVAQNSLTNQREQAAWATFPYSDLQKHSEIRNLMGECPEFPAPV